MEDIELEGGEAFCVRGSSSISDTQGDFLPVLVSSTLLPSDSPPVTSYPMAMCLSTRTKRVEDDESADARPSLAFHAFMANPYSIH